MGVTAYIALGSNLGERKAYLDAALAELRRHPGIVVSHVSRYWETAPVGGPPGQGPYLNAAARLETELGPRELLKALLSTEQRLGRVRAERDGPRIIDLDLLLYGNDVIQEPDLVVPHPRFHERTFVLGPLAEIAPTAVHPVLKKSIVELLVRLGGLNSPLSPLGRGVGGEGSEHQQALPLTPTLSLEGRGSQERSLSGVRAMVTGSSSGIGRAIALALANQGADVLIHARVSRERALQVVEQVCQRGCQSQMLLADLRLRDACQRLVEDAWRSFGPLDIWVNNAGADILTNQNQKLPFEAKLQELLAVDVAATMLLSRAIGARMKQAGHGVILNMGWDQAETGMEGDSGQLFGATKAAVMAFTKSLALTLAPEVRVNCLAPGWIRTAWGEKASAPWQERVVRETPLGRWGTPEDVAAVACWLVSPAAAFVTGQVIRINGGAVR